MQRAKKNHYATLGLDRRCTPAQIRAAYRALAKQHHPDLNPNSHTAISRTQELNAANEILSDPSLRAAHDRELNVPKDSSTYIRPQKTQRNISRDLFLQLENLWRGATREIRVNDPANPDGAETYQLVIPPKTAPGTRFRLPRGGVFADGFIQLRVKALPHFRFKVRGSDLCCDLKIKPERATQGGAEMIPGIIGARLRVPIPRGVGRNEIIRISGEGLPKPHGGRGDLLVRITYPVEVGIARASGR